MRACGGVWIAHGSGTADREIVDAQRPGRACRPTNPAYALRRVWLTEEEQDGYYYGFANEGLWPLCHIAFVRPIFRERDWEHYHAVNRGSPTPWSQEAHRDDPIVLVQDYHFALAAAHDPRATAARRRSSPSGTFPGPTPETFGICPWRERDHRRACSAAPSSASTPSSIATTSRGGGPVHGEPHRPRAKLR